MSRQIALDHTDDLAHYPGTDIEPEMLPGDYLIQLASNVQSLQAKDKSFAQSLIEQNARRGSLSDKQWYWVEVLAKRATGAERERPARQEVAVGDFTGVMDLLQTGHGKLKYPKIRLQTESGSPVVLGLAGPNSKAPGTVNVTDGGRYGYNVWYGRVERDGTFSQASAAGDEVVDLLTALSADPAEVAAAYGRLTGNCCFCSRGLEDERSTDVGYGPVCAKNYDLPWGVS